MSRRPLVAPLRRKPRRRGGRYIVNREWPPQKLAVVVVDDKCELRRIVRETTRTRMAQSAGEAWIPLMHIPEALAFRDLRRQSQPPLTCSIFLKSFQKIQRPFPDAPVPELQAFAEAYWGSASLFPPPLRALLPSPS